MPPQQQESAGIQWNAVTWYSKFLALLLFVVLVCGAFFFGIWYQEQQQKSFTNTASLNPETQIPSQSGLVDQIPRNTTTGTKTFTGSYPHFEVTFNYPDNPQYEIKEYKNNESDLQMASISINIFDKTADTYVMEISALGKGYCLFSWCKLSKKSTVVTTNATWEYLGSSSYVDGGETFQFKNIYRTYNGEFPVYVVTEEPVDLMDTSSSVTRIFNSLRFSK